MPKLPKKSCDSLKFPALKTQFSNIDLFTISMPMDQALAKLTFDDLDLIPNSWRVSRVLDPRRVATIANSLTHNQIMPLSGVLVCVDATPLFTQASSCNTIGQLSIPADARWIVTDGQHRLAALAAQSSSNQTATIPVHVLADPGLKNCQTIFNAIHHRSLGESKDQIDAISEKLATECPVFKGFIDWKRSALAPRSAMLFTLSALKTANRELLRNISSRDDLYDLTSAFWLAIDDLFPNWQQVREGMITAGFLRQNFLTTHGVVLQAMGRVGADFIVNEHREWGNTLAPWKKLDWSRHNDQWNGAITIAGRVWKSSTAVKNTYLILKKSCSGISNS